MKVDMSPQAIRGRLKAMEHLWVLSIKLTKQDSKKSRPTRAIAIYDAIRQVLVRDWDPMGIKETDCPTDEYDSYIPRVYRILVGSRSEEDLADCLHRIERDEIGVGPTPAENLRSVTDKLLQLKVALD
jgi:hypothetical protein